MFALCMACGYVSVLCACLEGGGKWGDGGWFGCGECGARQEEEGRMTAFFHQTSANLHRGKVYVCALQGILGRGGRGGGGCPGPQGRATLDAQTRSTCPKMLQWQL